MHSPPSHEQMATGSTKHERAIIDGHALSIHACANDPLATQCVVVSRTFFIHEI